MTYCPNCTAVNSSVEITLEETVFDQCSVCGQKDEFKTIDEYDYENMFNEAQAERAWEIREDK